ncbi:p21-activated protein kinase-interacting protein 1-like [Drosophila virilis]|uniref:Uncharacterized protein n=1 Tax=Drosophila virilis TaxID=7244 RepID=B4M7U7_DROVI|nr:p21-activated protein kinase-interacting protein 1-like [Drosophila virilis]EDW62864.2 uncharacterized protein Dvir_GJ16376 [Drosophila virilis]
MTMLPQFEIIVGTYDEYLLGYQMAWRRDKKGSDKIQLKATFADRSHDGSVKCLAVHGHLVATGGLDDRIFVYDMRTRKQAHVLNMHTSTVNTLVFTSDASHLMSGSKDGHLIATRLANWSTEAEWTKPHNGKAVTHVACHPSSRLCLSLGADLVLNTWNLIKGRIAYRTNLKSKRSLGSSPDCLAWSAEGNYFSMAGPATFEIWNIGTASVMRQIKMPSKPICATWLDDKNCVAGLENGTIAWISLDSDETAAPNILPGHSNRVKAISFMHNTVVSISSVGEIKVWSCDLPGKQLSLITSASIDCRPTCMSLLDTTQFSRQHEDTRDRIDKQKTARIAARIEALESLRNRSYVSIEYDEDAGETDPMFGRDADGDSDRNESDDNIQQSDYDSDDSLGESDTSETKPRPRPKQRQAKAARAPPIAKRSGKRVPAQDNSESTEDFISLSPSEESARPRLATTPRVQKRNAPIAKSIPQQKRSKHAN